jgi:hypothetical protein
MKLRSIATGLVAFVCLLSGCAEPGPKPVDHPVAAMQFAATPFHAYDNAVVDRIERRWYDQLDSRKFKIDRHGKVIIQFQLHSDGTVSDLKTEDNEVDPVLEYLCKASITESAPFATWPPDMARLIGKDYREITITFTYL